MRRLGSGPASQQDVQANAQVNQSNQTQRHVQAAIRWHQDHLRVHRDGMPHERVGSPRVDAVPVLLSRQFGDPSGLNFIYRRELIALFDSCLSPWPIRFHLPGHQLAGFLYPPDAIVRHLELTFFLKVNPSEGGRSRRQQEQQDGSEADLGLFVHGPVRWRYGPQGWASIPLNRIVQLRCQARSHGRSA